MAISSPCSHFVPTKTILYMVLYGWDTLVIQNQDSCHPSSPIQTLDRDFQCCFTCQFSHTYLTHFLCCWLNPLISCLHPLIAFFPTLSTDFAKPIDLMHRTFFKNRPSALSSERSPLHTNSNFLDFPLMKFSTISTYGIISKYKLLWLN